MQLWTISFFVVCGWGRVKNLTLWVPEILTEMCTPPLTPEQNTESGALVSLFTIFSRIRDCKAGSVEQRSQMIQASTRERHPKLEAGIGRVLILAYSGCLFSLLTGCPWESYSI